MFEEKDYIIYLYLEVFDINGNIKLCGREKCIELINNLSKKFPRVNFGNNESGMMNVTKIKKYIKKINSGGL